jgi:ABC-type nitrate/sulfonate/bicarbonate transport system substrate-binding protein
MRVHRTRALGALALTLAIAGGVGASTAAQSPAAPEPLTIRFGQLPYLDYAPWALAEEKGFLAEEGITFDKQTFEVEQPMYEAMLGGSIDVGDSGDTPFILAAARAPELRLITLTNIFAGYSIMARPDDGFKTYDEAFAANGGDREAALAEVAGQLKGKTIILPGGASFTPVLDTALGYAGLTRDDVEILDLDPVEGAAAFIQGTADFYSDGLPQRFRLEQEGMVNILTGPQLAGGAMDLAGLGTTQAFLDAHPDAPVRLLRAWYKAIDFLRTNEDEALGVMVDWINEQSGAGFTKEDAKRFLTDLVIVPTLEESGPMFWTDPESPYYWMDRLQFVVDFFAASEGLDASAIDLRTLVPAPDLFAELTAAG